MSECPYEPCDGIHTDACEPWLHQIWAQIDDAALAEACDPATPRHSLEGQIADLGFTQDEIDAADD